MKKLRAIDENRAPIPSPTANNLNQKSQKNAL